MGFSLINSFIAELRILLHCDWLRAGQFISRICTCLKAHAILREYPNIMSSVYMIAYTN